MDAEAFLGITLSILVLRWWWKGQKFKYRARTVEPVKQVVFPITDEESEALDLLAEAEARRQKDIADLKKQGYSDELITTILPVIHNK